VPLIKSLQRLAGASVTAPTVQTVAVPVICGTVLAFAVALMLKPER
jgi:hypothetical protein